MIQSLIWNPTEELFIFMGQMMKLIYPFISKMRLHKQFPTLLWNFLVIR
nr:MAG TPA: hypothetical protein [Caudoviricetes sp.]